MPKKLRFAIYSCSNQRKEEKCTKVVIVLALICLLAASCTMIETGAPVISKNRKQLEVVENAPKEEAADDKAGLAQP